LSLSYVVNITIKLFFCTWCGATAKWWLAT